MILSRLVIKLCRFLLCSITALKNGLILLLLSSSMPLPNSSNFSSETIYFYFYFILCTCNLYPVFFSPTSHVISDALGYFFCIGSLQTIFPLQKNNANAKIAKRQCQRHLTLTSFLNSFLPWSFFQTTDQ